LRQTYDLSPTSELIRDIVFYADDRRIEFDNVVQWREQQQLLKVGFDLNILSQTVKNEIQFGHVNRPTHENTSVDMAKFEVCNHRWSDLSESRYGVALLNDCKYGIGVDGSDMRLTLLKSGCRPDPRGDAGTHKFSFSLLPHPGGFSTDSVVRPAYELNEPLLVTLGKVDNLFSEPIVEVEKPNIIVEAIKPMEWDEDSASVLDYTVLRIYECEGSRTRTSIQFSAAIQSVESSNMLEESNGAIEMAQGEINLEFHPFEIKTLKIS
jgi:alpha-mannosidase